MLWGPRLDIMASAEKAIDELVANANAIKNRQELALTRSFDEKLKQQTMTLFRVTEFLIRKFPPKSSSEPNVRVIFTKDLPMWPNVNSVESARKIMDDISTSSNALKMFFKRDMFEECLQLTRLQTADVFALEGFISLYVAEPPVKRQRRDSKFI